MFSSHQTSALSSLSFIYDDTSSPTSMTKNSNHLQVQKENIAPFSSNNNSPVHTPMSKGSRDMWSFSSNSEKRNNSQLGNQKPHLVRQLSDTLPNVIDVYTMPSATKKRYSAEPALEPHSPELSPMKPEFDPDSEKPIDVSMLTNLITSSNSQSVNGLSLPILEKVIQLSESLNRSHHQMQECYQALKASINRQNEIKTYYQTLVKHMTSQKESEEAELRERIRQLEEENHLLSGGSRPPRVRFQSTGKPLDQNMIQLSQHATSECQKMKKSLFYMRKEVESFSQQITNEFDVDQIVKVMQRFIHRSVKRDNERVQRRIVDQLDFVKGKYKEELALRKQLQNELMEERGNIRVFCRVRPFLKSEKKESALQIPSDDSVSVLHKAGKVRQFDMDTVYSMEATQDQVFQDVKPLLSSVFDGYNVCILAYGQTGSGKTYTMEGVSDSPGVIPRALSELFSIARQKQDVFSIKFTLSMIEIYNNDIRDLLISPRSSTKKIEYADVGEGGLEVKNVLRVEVNEISEVQKYIRLGSSHRAEGATLMNSNSSRSHSIVTIDVECNQTEKGKQKLGFIVRPTKAKLRLVDLAGSECVGMSGVTGEAQMEASHVNRSLSALSDVMKALSTPNRTHIPYRNSRLTHFLQDSLGGDAKMIIFVNVSPTLKCITETTHSLSFGSRVRHITRGKAQKHLKL